MKPINRIGMFCIFCGGMALIIFWASLSAPEKKFDFIALLAAAGLMALGWVLRTAKRQAPPEEEAEPPPPPPKKKEARGLFRRRPRKKKADADKPNQTSE
jgi:hypothetical protein